MPSLRFALAAALLMPAAAFAQPSAVHGSLTPNDPTRPGGPYYDEYEFEVGPDEMVTVRMQSTTFDTYLIVRSPSGAEQISDDFEGTMISQVEIMVPEPGRWVAWASSYSANTTGDYTLSIRTRSMADGRLVQGRLDRQDQRALKGEFYDTHTFESRGEGEVYVHLASLGFDGYLVVTRPDGVVIREHGPNSEVVHVGPLPAMRGTWRVDVTTESEGMVGAYDLRFLEDR